MNAETDTHFELIEILVTLIGSHYEFDVQLITSRLLSFDTPQRRVSSAPQRSDLPMLYEVRFTAKNFKFISDPNRAIEWVLPEQRPPFISVPAIIDNGSVCSLTCVNSSMGPEIVEFKLIPNLENASAIDPTIINNPDGPPP